MKKKNFEEIFAAAQEELTGICRYLLLISLVRVDLYEY